MSTRQREKHLLRKGVAGSLPRCSSKNPFFFNCGCGLENQLPGTLQSKAAKSWLCTHLPRRCPVPGQTTPQKAFVAEKLTPSPGVHRRNLGRRNYICSTLLCLASKQMYASPKLKDKTGPVSSTLSVRSHHGWNSQQLSCHIVPNRAGGWYFFCSAIYLDAPSVFRWESAGVLHFAYA